MWPRRCGRGRGWMGLDAVRLFCLLLDPIPFEDWPPPKSAPFLNSFSLISQMLFSKIYLHSIPEAFDVRPLSFVSLLRITISDAVFGFHVHHTRLIFIYLHRVFFLPLHRVLSLSDTFLIPFHTAFSYWNILHSILHPCTLAIPSISLLRLHCRPALYSHYYLNSSCRNHRTATISLLDHPLNLTVDFHPFSPHYFLSFTYPQS